MTVLLSAIFDSMLLNDVAKRTSISDVDLLKKLVAYLLRASDNLFSTNSIVNTPTSSGRKTTQRTINGYLEALKNALIAREVPRTGLRGKEMFHPKRKSTPSTPD